MNIEEKIRKDNEAFDNKIRQNYYRKQNFTKVKTLFEVSAFVDNFKPVYFKDFDINAQGKEAVEIMKLIKKVGKQFTNQIINNQIVHGLFYGYSGRGKTFLSRIIMCECIKKAKGVLFVNALYLKKFLKNKNLRDKYFEYLSQADLVIIDDLGVETTMKMNRNNNIKQADEDWQQDLYEVLNLLENKGLLVTTNLTKTELSKTYNPNLFSRLQAHTNNTGSKEINSFKVNFFTKELKHDLRTEK